jgi:hypothetical protein
MWCGKLQEWMYKFIDTCNLLNVFVNMANTKLFFGLWCRVDSWVDTDVLEKHTQISHAEYQASAMLCSCKSSSSLPPGYGPSTPEVRTSHLSRWSEARKVKSTIRRLRCNFFQWVCNCNVISDYTVGSLLKNTRWIYFTLLEVIISWINGCCFTNHSPDYLDINVCFYVINPFFQSCGAGWWLLTPAAQLAHACRALHSPWVSLSLDSQLFTELPTTQYLWYLYLYQRPPDVPSSFHQPLECLEHWLKLLEHFVSWTRCMLEVMNHTSWVRGGRGWLVDTLKLPWLRVT